MLMQISARRFISLLLCPPSRNAKKVLAEFVEASNVAFNSNNQCCSSFSTAVSSDSITPQQGQKKVTKQERSAMVLAFVQKYMAMNDGKFPTVSCVQKQIGGSFYVTRLIIQELEHNNKKASLESKKEVKIREENARCGVFPLTEQPDISADAKQMSFKECVGGSSEMWKKGSSKKSKAGTKASLLSIEAHSDRQIEINAQKQLILSSVCIESQEDGCLGFDNLRSSSPSIRLTVEPQTCTSGISDVAMSAENRACTELEAEAIILHAPTKVREISEKDVAFTGNLQDTCCPEGKKMNNQEVFRSEELYHGHPERVEQGVASTNGSSFWGYLKSMAAGIITGWKR